MSAQLHSPKLKSSQVVTKIDLHLGNGRVVTVRAGDVARICAAGYRKLAARYAGQPEEKDDLLDTLEPIVRQNTNKGLLQILTATIGGNSDGL